MLQDAWVCVMNVCLKVRDFHQINHLRLTIQCVFLETPLVTFWKS